MDVLREKAGCLGTSTAGKARGMNTVAASVLVTPVVSAAVMYH